MAGELMTLAEISDRFDSEWVLVADPELDENLDVVRGNVLFHSKDRDEVDRKAFELRPQRIAFIYTGHIPDDTVVVL